MNDGPAVVRGPGESFYEAPGCHHVLGENASEGETKFFAVFVVDDTYLEKEGLGGLVVLDAEVEEKGQGVGVDMH